MPQRWAPSFLTAGRSDKDYVPGWMHPNPRFSVEYFEKRSTVKDKALKKQLSDGWRKAGLK
jgi:hypothetical protein